MLQSFKIVRVFISPLAGRSFMDVKGVSVLGLE